MCFLVPLLRQVAGFRACYVLHAGNDTAIMISLFDTDMAKQADRFASASRSRNECLCSFCWLASAQDSYELWQVVLGC